MEKQSTRKFFSLMIAMVALFVLGLSGVLMSACTTEHVHDYQKDAENSIAASCQSIGLEVFKCSEDGAWYFKPVAAVAHNFNSDGVCTVCGITKTEEVDYAKELEASFNGLQTAINKKIEDTALNLLKKGDLDNIATKDQFNNLVTKGDATALQNALTQAIEAVKYDDANLKTLINEVKADIDAKNTALNQKLDNILNAIENAHKHTLGAETTVPATCRDAGYKYATCSVCGEVVVTEIIPATQQNHEWDMDNAQTVEATCGREGFVVYGCKHCDSVLQIVLEKDPTKHVWGEWTVTTEATCTAEGVETRTCENCNAPETRPVEMIAHSYGDPVVVYDEDDCTAKGTSTVTCTVCEHPEVSEVDALYTEHVWEDRVNTTRATCEDVLAGETVKCQHCNTTHVYEDEAGISHEAHLAKVADLPVIDSKIIAIDVAGNTATVADYKECPDCGAILKTGTRTTYHLWTLDVEKTEAQENIAAATAADAEYPYVNTSCTADAYIYYYCADENCVAHKEDGHKSGTEGQILLPALNHDWVLTAEGTTAPTCTEAGNNHYVCSHDATHTKDETVAALGHLIPEEYTIVTAPTCTTPGVGSYTCERCHELQTEVEIPALNHDLQRSEPEFITENGVHYEVITITCSRCDYTDTEKTALAAGHAWKKLDRHDGGCDSTLRGHAIYVCEICLANADLENPDDLLFLENKALLNEFLADGSAYIADDEIVYGANGHVWVLTSSGENSCITVCQQEYTCPYCGMKDTITNHLPEGHNWIKVAGTEATCDTAGQETFYYCSTCGAVVVADEMPSTMESHYYELKYNVAAGADNSALLAALKIAPLGHTFDRLVTLGTANCTEPGWSIKVCSVCGHTATEELVLKADAEGANLSGDNYIDPSIEGADDAAIANVLALIAEKGVTLSELTNGAGYNFTAITYSAVVGHTWTQLTEKVAPTCEEVGYEASWYCSVCGVVHKADAEPDKNVTPNTEILLTKVDGEWNITDEIKDNFKLDTVDHDVKYYKYVVTNEGDRNTAVVTNDFVMDGEEKKVYTFDEIKTAGYTYVNDEGEEVVNCYFKAFCAYGCDTDLGFNKQHVYPTPDNTEKYPNCQHAGFCVYCSKALLPMGAHNVLPVDEIEGHDETIAALADEDWWPENVAPTCTVVGHNYSVKVCVGDLEAIEDGETVTWVEGENYVIVDTEVPATGHTWETHTYQTGTQSSEEIDCLVGSYKIDICEVCDAVKVDGTTDEDGHYDVVDPKPHKVAPVINYFTNNYLPATSTNAAWMSYVCLDCGARVQGFYGGADYALGGSLLQYTMATDAEIEAYIADGSIYGSVQIARAEDKVIPVAAATAEDFSNAINADTEYVIVSLSENITVAALSFDEAARNVTIALNGKTLSVTNQTTVRGISLTIEGGKYTTTSETAFFLYDDAALTLTGVELTSGIGGAAVLIGTSSAPAKGAVVIKDCTIVSNGYYGVFTNANMSADSMVDISIINSSITVTNDQKDSTAVVVNVPGKLKIDGCELTADRQVVLIRGGNIEANISNTRMMLTNASTADAVKTTWSSGNEVDMGAIVVGNKNGSGYQDGVTKVTLENVEITVTAVVGKEVPEIVKVEKEGLTVTITVDGEAWAPAAGV